MIPNMGGVILRLHSDSHSFWGERDSMRIESFLFDYLSPLIW